MKQQREADQRSDTDVTQKLRVRGIVRLILCTAGASMHAPSASRASLMVAHMLWVVTERMIQAPVAA